MGLFNTLVGVKVPCPVCRREMTTSLQFKVGPCYQYEYRLGEKIDWSRDGTLHSPEFRGNDRAEYSVGIDACDTCCRRYAGQYRKVRELLAVARRLERIGVPPRELAEHDDPSQQDGYFLVDGIYPVHEWIEFEMERLGAVVTRFLASWDGVLVIRNDVLSEVMPAAEAKPHSPPTIEDSLRNCLMFETGTKSLMDLPAWQNERGRAFLDNRIIDICRRMEFVEKDPALNTWLIHVRQKIAKGSLTSWQAASAVLNAQMAMESESSLKILKDILQVDIDANWPFADLARLAQKAVEMRLEGQPARIVLQFTDESDKEEGAESSGCQANVAIAEELGSLPSVSDTDLPELKGSGGFYFPPPGPDEYP